MSITDSPAAPKPRQTRKPKAEPAPKPKRAGKRRAPVAEPAPTTGATTGGTDAFDRRTHIERINPGDNPAHIPGQ